MGSSDNDDHLRPKVGVRGGLVPAPALEGPTLAAALEGPTLAAALESFSRGGLGQALGFELVSANAAEVALEWSVDARHRQPQGIVHGGVYASAVESCCSIGALLAAPPGMHVVGVENHTSFLRPVREGRLRARATPLHVGRRAQLWECAILDVEQRLIATGRLRLMCVEPGSGTER